MRQLMLPIPAGRTGMVKSYLKNKAVPFHADTPRGHVALLLGSDTAAHVDLALVAALATSMAAVDNWQPGKTSAARIENFTTFEVLLSDDKCLPHEEAVAFVIRPRSGEDIPNRMLKSMAIHLTELLAEQIVRVKREGDTNAQGGVLP